MALMPFWYIWECYSIIKLFCYTGSKCYLPYVKFEFYLDDLVAEKRNSIANALAWRLSYTNPSILLTTIYKNASWYILSITAND